MSIKRKTFNARNVVIEMLGDRGYDIDMDKYRLSYDDFSIIYDEDNYDIYIKDTEKDIYVSFQTDVTKLSNKRFMKILEKVFGKFDMSIHENDMRIIIVIPDKIPNSVKETLIMDKYSNIEIFSLDEIQVNKTKHFLVPKHIPLNDNQKEEVLKKYPTIKLDQFPKIIVGIDPIAKYYNIQKDQMVKIIRKSPISGEVVVYRVGA